MKKTLAFMASALLAAGIVGGAMPAKANAEEVTTASHVEEVQTTIGGIAPFAYYKFDAEENFGKDQTGRFDLTQKINGAGKVELKEENGMKYAAFRRNKEKDNPDYSEPTQSTSGVSFYAKGLDKSSLDFSDIVAGSYTLSVTFRAPFHPDNYGACTIVALGRFNDALSIVPWQTGIEIQPYSRYTFGEVSQGEVDGKKVVVPCDRRNWLTFTVVGDYDANEVRAYVNGELAGTYEVNPVSLTNKGVMNGPQGGADYCFSIGSANSIGGGGMEATADADIKDVALFDYALDNNAVKAVYDEEGVTYSGANYTTLPELDVSDIDMQITDANTISNVLNKFSTKKAKVSTTNNDGDKETLNVFWTTAGTTDTIYGIPQSETLANIKGVHYKYKCDTVIKFVYDKNAVTLSEATLKKIDLDVDKVNVLPDDVANLSSTLSFKVEPKDGYEIVSVMCDNADEFDKDLWETDEHFISIRVRNGAKVIVESRKIGGNDPVDSGSSGNSSGGSTSGKTDGKGCKGSLSAGFFPVALAAAAVIVSKKKRK